MAQSTKKREKIVHLLTGDTKINETITVKGWVRSFRNNQFIALNDGSTNNNLQIVVDFENTDPKLLKRITTSAAISVQGKLIASQGKGQKVEVVAENIEILGDCNPDDYPLQLKKDPASSTSAKLPTFGFARIPLARFSACDIRSRMPSINFSTTGASCTCTRPLLRLPMPRARAKCSA